MFVMPVLCDPFTQLFMFAYVLIGVHLSSIATTKIHNICVYSLICPSMVLLMVLPICGCRPFHCILACLWICSVLWPLVFLVCSLYCRELDFYEN